MMTSRRNSARVKSNYCGQTMTNDEIIEAFENCTDRTEELDSTFSNLMENYNQLQEQIDNDEIEIMRLRKMLKKLHKRGGRRPSNYFANVSLADQIAKNQADIGRLIEATDHCLDTEVTLTEKIERARRHIEELRGDYHVSTNMRNALETKVAANLQGIDTKTSRWRYSDVEYDSDDD